MTTIQNTKPKLSLGTRLLTVAALLGLFTAAWLLSSISSSYSNGQLATPAGGVSATDLRSTTMRIAPAPVIDSGAEIFIGAGDGGNGSWTRP